MTYDQWKTDSGYDEAPCYHEDYEIDILTGRSRCDGCSETWYPTDDEIRSFREQEASYDAHCRREERREAWREFWQRWFWRPTLPTRLAVDRLFIRLLPSSWSRKITPINTDDEIPF